MAQLIPTGSVTPGNPSSSLNNINLLQPTAFKLIVDRVNYKNLEFFCQSVVLPALVANAAEVPYRRISRVPFAADALTYGELNANVLLDENMNSYVELYNWMHRLVEENEVAASQRDPNSPPTYSDITVSILSSHNNITRTVKFKNCAPTTLGDVQLETTTGDVQGIVVPVSFRFTDFEL